MKDRLPSVEAVAILHEVGLAIMSRGHQVINEGTNSEELAVSLSDIIEIFATIGIDLNEA